MGFLNARRPVSRHAKVNIVLEQHLADQATPLAGQRNDPHVRFVSRLDRFNDIGRVAGGGDSQQHITGMAQAANLSGKNLVERVVIANGSQDLAICRQRDGGQFLALGFETTDQFGSKVL